MIGRGHGLKPAVPKRSMLRDYGPRRISRLGELVPEDRTRQNISSNSPYEPLIGFSRAVRAGNTVYVSGTVAWGPDGVMVGIGDIYAQAKQAIANIAAALAQAGGSLSDVVRTCIYVTDIDLWEEGLRAHREAFAAIRPASTLIEVSRLAAPEMLVEIEAIAVLGLSSDGGALGLEGSV
jgi:enamine deaminase RidA (YjgF/YER057c/UK114 family)